MIKTLKVLSNNLKRERNQERLHNTAMDLAESLLRHLAVLAICAYKAEGKRNRVCDQILARELPWPSMGSWKNFLDVLAGAQPEYFPDNFHKKFLTPLKRKLKNPAIKEAYDLARRVVEYAATPDRELLDSCGQSSCSALEFLDLLVSYRNAYSGHATHVLTEPQLRLLPLLQTGLRALNNELRPVWLAFPVYLAERGTSAGAPFFRFVPLVEDPGLQPIEIPGDSYIDTGLYVRLDAKRRTFAALYPAALWHGDDILFLNGASDFRDIKYLGYVGHAQMKTDKHEEAFCNFVLPFMGGQSLNSTNLEDARVKAQGEVLQETGWSFPRFKKGTEVGPEENRYRLLKHLGRGGMADVWQAKSLSDNEIVAIKFLLKPDLAARFRREARALEKFSGASDRIVQFRGAHYDPHPARRVFMLVMEYLPEGSLEDHLSADVPVNYQTLLDWIEDVLKGLQVVHESGAVHRDIKPANLMFDQQLRAKLGDLGLVGAQEDADIGELVTRAGLTRTGEAIGTYEFCALEQLEGGSEDRPVGPWSDLFSLGVSLYYLITGEFPYGSGNLSLILRKHYQAKSGKSAGPQPVLKLRSDCPEVVNNLIMGMIQAVPERRPQDVATVLAQVQEVREILSGEKSNTNLNLFGHLRGQDVEFKDLMPPWCSFFLYRIWPLVMILQWLLVIPLSWYNGTWSEIDHTTFSLDPQHYQKLHPFWHDYMFLAWNSIPFVLIGLLYRARRGIQPLMQRIHDLDQDHSGPHWTSIAKRNDTWARVISHPGLAACFLAVAIFACYVQITKLSKLTQQGEIYWWDWQLSPATFIIRDVALFFDMIGVLLVLIIVAAMVDIVSHVLRGSELRIDLFNTDGAGGLSDIGRLLVLYLPFLTVVAFNALVGTVDHRGQDLQQVVAEWLGLGGLMAAHFFLMIWATLPGHQQIRRCKQVEIDLLSERRQGVQRRLHHLLEGQMELNLKRADEYVKLRGLQQELIVSERLVARQGSWPLRRRTAVYLVLMGVVPFSTAIVIFLLW